MTGPDELKKQTFDNVFEQIRSALHGERGSDQQRIAAVGLDWLTTLLSKNHDYGSSAWKVPVLRPGTDPGDAILVRMSDKIERLKQLSMNATLVDGESFEDTIGDLGGYCLLYLARPQFSGE